MPSWQETLQAVSEQVVQDVDEMTREGTDRRAMSLYVNLAYDKVRGWMRQVLIGGLRAVVEIKREEEPVSDDSLQKKRQKLSMLRLTRGSTLIMRNDPDQAKKLAVIDAQIATLESEIKEEEEEASMATKKNEVEKSDVPPVVREGRAIVLPEGMDTANAIKALEKALRYEESVVAVVERIAIFPWDGAWALEHCVSEKFGWLQGEVTHGLFGDVPPQRRAIEIGYQETAYINWGRFSIPGIEGELMSGTYVDDRTQLMGFEIRAEVKQKHEHVVHELAELVRSYLRNGGSIYQGKPIKIRFTDDHGDRNPIPTPTFLDVSQAVEDRLVFSKDVMDQIGVNLYQPVDHRDLLPRIGETFRRGVLLAGRYGTGKTEVAFTVGNKATAQGITFIYCELAADLPQALLFAQQYAPAVVFVEDIDRVTSGERTVELDHVLNSLDGIDSKGQEVMVVLTTNSPDAIHQAMIRPGRVDVVIEFHSPDQEAIIRLLHLYGRGLISDDEYLGNVAERLTGYIPAVIGEVVKRAKLAALRRVGEGTLTITAEDLMVAAESMRTQVRLLNQEKPRTPGDLELMGHVLGHYLTESVAFSREHNGRKLIEMPANTDDSAHRYWADDLDGEALETPAYPADAFNNLRSNPSGK